MMTFLELQKRIVQTRKARRGVKNRTDYFDNWQEEKFWKAVYKRALRAANEVVQHYDASSSFDKSEKISVMFGERKDTTTKELSAYPDLQELYSKQVDELSQLQQKNRELSEELEQVKRKLKRENSGRRKDYRKEATIQLYKHEHPDASIRAIAKAVGCSTTTVQVALKAVKSDDNGTLSVTNIPRDRKKLERMTEALLDVIARDTNEKDKQIHLQTLRWYQSALDELDDE